MQLSDSDLQLIKKYLSGRLDAEQRREFDLRLAADADFREEVDFHQKLFATLRDNEFERLKKILGDEEAAHFPPPPPPNRWAWFGWLLAILGIGAATWFFFFREQPQPPLPQPPPSESAPTQPIQNQLDKDSVVAPPAPRRPLQPPSQPIARAEDRQPNASREALINSQMRSASGVVEVKSPAVSAVFRLDKNGEVSVRFAGSFELDDAPPTDGRLVLSIFNNRDKKSVFTGTYSIEAAADGRFSFDFLQRLGLPAGLFYYSLERSWDGEVVWVGRFFLE